MMSDLTLKVAILFVALGILEERLQATTMTNECVSCITSRHPELKGQEMQLRECAESSTKFNQNLRFCKILLHCPLEGGACENSCRDVPVRSLFCNQ